MNFLMCCRWLLDWLNACRPKILMTPPTHMVAERIASASRK